jgi:hypothetical protein
MQLPALGRSTLRHSQHTQPCPLCSLEGMHARTPGQQQKLSKAGSRLFDPLVWGVRAPCTTPPAPSCTPDTVLFTALEAEPCQRLCSTSMLTKLPYSPRSHSHHITQRFPKANLKPRVQSTPSIKDQPADSRVPTFEQMAEKDSRVEQEARNATSQVRGWWGSLLRVRSGWLDPRRLRWRFRKVELTLPLMWQPCLITKAWGGGNGG